jgi:polysaccharide chain length determinant protein (PEP-CTERM system associated)
MEERAFHPLDYVSVLRRRKWWLITPLVLALVVGALLTVFLPREYYSEAEIGIAAPTLSPELLRGVQSMDKEERQRAISQQLLSRNVLERVVREEKLLPEQPVEATAAWLRARVEINVDRPLGKLENKNGLDTFRLGYVDATAEQTQRITNRLAYVFVEENSKSHTQQAENTSEVLAQQLRQSEDNLKRLGEELRLKKEANVGRLPQQIDANVSMVNGLNQRLDAISTQLSGYLSRLSQLDSEIDAMKQGAGGLMTATGSAAIQTTQARINQLQQQLTAARANGFGDKHPEIVSLQQEMAQARAELNAERQSGGGPRNDILQADPIYRQKVNERNATKIQIDMLRRSEASARQQIARYQRAVDAAPMVEQELSTVQGEYDFEKVRHADLKAKYDNATLAEGLARKQGGERFAVLYPAGLPSKPMTPDLLKLWLMTMAAGFAIGLAAVVGREFLDRSVHDARALQSEFEVPVLGEIPRIHGAV